MDAVPLAERRATTRTGPLVFNEGGIVCGIELRSLREPPRELALQSRNALQLKVRVWC